MSFRKVASPFVATARIFGHRLNPDGSRSGWAELRHKPSWERMKYHFPFPQFRMRIPFYEPEKITNNRERNERRAMRGKPVPKKGAGKQQKKKRK
jgi:hypothetical protein